MGKKSRIYSKGKEVVTEKGQSAGMPQVHYAQHPLKSFVLNLLHDKIAQSRENLIEDILVMLKAEVEEEMRKLPPEDRKPVTVHGKQYTPIEGSFLVELVHPGKETVTLLFGMDNLYLQGIHVIDLWFLMKGCTAPLPPSSQKPYGPKTINAGTENEYKFDTGIYHFKWSGSYLDLECGMEQKFFFRAAEQAHKDLSRAQELVITQRDEELQPGVAFFALCIPECTRFPHVDGWVSRHTEPGAEKGVTPPPELQILMKSWGTKSDLSYSEETSLEVRRCLRIIKRNPAKHCKLELETPSQQGSTSRLHSKKAKPKISNNALEPKINDDPEYQDGPSKEDDMVDVEEGTDDSEYPFFRHTDGVVSVACSPKDDPLFLLEVQTIEHFYGRLGLLTLSTSWVDMRILCVLWGSVQMAN